MKMIPASDLNDIVLSVCAHTDSIPTVALVRLKGDLWLPNRPKVAFDCAESLRTHFSDNVFGSVTPPPWKNN